MMLLLSLLSSLLATTNETTISNEVAIISDKALSFKKNTSEDDVIRILDNFDRQKALKINEIDLNSMNLTKLPSKLGTLFSNLEILDLSGNNLTELDKDVFHGLENLKKLNLYKNKLKTLHDDIFKDLSNLIILSLLGNPLKIPNECVFSPLKKLSVISIAESATTFDVRAFFKELKKSNKLKELKKSNKLKENEENINESKENEKNTNKPKKKVSFLIENSIWFPSNAVKLIYELSKSRSYCFIKNISDLNQLDQALQKLSLPQFKDLQVLIFENLSGVANFSPGLLKLPENIEELIFNNTSLESIPKEVFELKKLIRLKVLESPIKEIPDSIKKLSPTLISFMIDKCSQLNELPDCIGRLKNLQKLILTNNSLKYIPSSIKNLRNLTFIEVSGNSILDEVSDSENKYGLNKLKKMFKHLEENAKFSDKVPAKTSKYESTLENQIKEDLKMHESDSNEDLDATLKFEDVATFSQNSSPEHDSKEDFDATLIPEEDEVSQLN